MTDQQKYYEARQILKGRDRVCVNCGETENIEMHHIVPLSKGGTNNEGNLVWLCTDCHYKAHGADVFYKDGKIETYKNGEMMWRRSASELRVYPCKYAV